MSTVQGIKLWLLSLLVLLAACSPAVYRKPANDFKQATGELEQAYFLELELSNRAWIERNNLEDQIDLWIGVPKERFPQLVERMAVRSRRDLHADLKPLREQAFAVLQGYAATLANLAADEPTEEIVGELDGLTQDLEQVLQAAQQVDAAAATVARFAGPLRQYVGVLQELVRLVSSVLREQAISETIGRSNDAVLALLEVLRDEAVAARDNVVKELQAARNGLNRYVASEAFQTTATGLQAAVAERLVRLQTLEDRMRDDQIEASFAAAARAQGALVRKALSSDPGDWALRIRAFREQVVATRSAIERARGELR